MEETEKKNRKMLLLSENELKAMIGFMMLVSIVGIGVAMKVTRDSTIMQVVKAFNDHVEAGDLMIILKKGGKLAKYLGSLKTIPAQVAFMDQWDYLDALRSLMD